MFLITLEEAGFCSAAAAAADPYSLAPTRHLVGGFTRKCFPKWHANALLIYRHGRTQYCGMCCVITISRPFPLSLTDFHFTLHPSSLCITWSPFLPTSSANTSLLHVSDSPRNDKRASDFIYLCLFYFSGSVLKSRCTQRQHPLAAFI